MKRMMKTRVFIENQNTPGIKLNKKKSKGGNQPPKNNSAVKADIKIMLAYSPNEKSAKPIAEYSTL